MDVTRFGAVPQDRSMQLHIPAGLLGFPGITHYCIVDTDPELPVQWLQAQEEARLAFVIVDPFLLLPDYRVDLTPLDLMDVGAQTTTHLFLLTIVTLPRTATDYPTVNLQGPLLVNRANGLAKQLVLVQGLYHTHHPLTLLAPTASANGSP